MQRTDDTQSVADVLLLLAFVGIVMITFATCAWQLLHSWRWIDVLRLPLF